jgi:hypothetical protein
VATDVALTATVAGLGKLPGAVYNPEELTMPQLEPEHPLPLTDHVTPVWLVPTTVAVNCCVPLSATVALVGDIEITLPRITVAVPDMAGFSTDCAVTVTMGGEGGVAGAV